MEIVQQAGLFIRPIENNHQGTDFRLGKFYPYFDVSRYSIGYGTLSTPDDRSGISVAEAVRRNENHITADYNAIKNILSGFRDNQKIALLSYAYQNGVSGLLNSEFYRLAKTNSLTKEWALRQPYANRRLKEVNKFNEIVSSSQLQWALLLVFAIIGIRFCCK